MFGIILVFHLAFMIVQFKNVKQQNAYTDKHVLKMMQNPSVMNKTRGYIHQNTVSEEFTIRGNGVAWDESGENKNPPRGGYEKQSVIMSEVLVSTTPPGFGLGSIAVLMLACNRPEETSLALSSWSQVSGISEIPFFASIDCNPGIHIDIDMWKSAGLHIQELSSHQRFVTEEGPQKIRRDERVTRHWLWAVSHVLSKYDFVLYAEDDHVVLPEILRDTYTLIEFAEKACPACFAVQLGCHGDCWGGVSNNKSLVKLMEPGNMGVVYSRIKWNWFTLHIREYCQRYGDWDHNLHFFLEQHVYYKYALTFLKTRIKHIATCRSSRTQESATNGGACDRDAMKTQVKSFMKTSSTPTLHIHTTRPHSYTYNIGTPNADATTQARCEASVIQP